MSVTLPGPTLGVVGGGQLGRMLAEAAAPLGVDVVVLDPTPECPASAVARDQVVGGFDDPDAFDELAARVDALTFEIELADPGLLETVGDDHDVPVHPSPDTLRMIEDKLVQKRELADNGVPVPEFHAVDDVADLEAAVEAFGGVMLKARTGGYDGRGNVPVESVDEAADALDEVAGPAMAETFLDFEREVSVMGVKGADGVRTFPVTETIHREEILRESVTPARTSDAVSDRADEVARDVLSLLDGRGVYGIELFETREGEILVNEIAPRPHNSGHWTIEGARTSQFEQHVRAVLGWPLGSTALRSPSVTANVLGDVEETVPAMLSGVERVLDAPGASMHWYGKHDVRPLRKMGHLTVTGDGVTRDERDVDLDGTFTDAAEADLDALLSRARELRDTLTFRTEIH